MPPLPFYHAALGIDVLVSESDVAAPVAQDEQTAVKRGLTSRRHFADVVYCLVYRGECVQVLAELYAYRLEPPYQRVAREMFGAVKGEMLEEMRQSALVLTLDYRPHATREEEIGTARGRLVMVNVIGQPVGQLAAHDIRVCGVGRNPGDDRQDYPYQ